MLVLLKGYGGSAPIDAEWSKAQAKLEHYLADPWLRSKRYTHICEYMYSVLTVVPSVRFLVG